MKEKLKKKIVRLLDFDEVKVGKEEKRVFYVCDTEFLRSDPVFQHLSFKELYFYREIPRRFRIRGENHSLSVQKNIVTNEFEVIKKYDKRKIPKNAVSKHIRKAIKEIQQGDGLTPNQIYSKLFKEENHQEFMQSCLDVVFKDGDLWKAVRKAEEIRNVYYKNDSKKVQFKKCLHHEPVLAPFCLLKEVITDEMRGDSRF